MRLRCTVALVGVISVCSWALLAPAASAATTTTTAGGATTGGATTTIPATTSAALKKAVLKAVSTSTAANSVTVTGSASQGKQVITLNLEASDDAEGVGSIGISGSVVRAIRVGKNIYFNANSKFWKENGGASAAALFDGKWVETAATSNNGQPLAQFLDVTTLFHELFGGDFSSAVFSSGKNTTLHGIKVIAYTGKDAVGGTGGTIYVARTGKPYVLELLSLGGAKGHSLVVFSGYNKPVNAVAPKGAVDIDTLKQGTSG
jgi:hypothetical protein